MAMDLVVDALVELWLTKDGEALRLAERAVAIKESLLGSRSLRGGEKPLRKARVLNRMDRYPEQISTLKLALSRC